MTSFWTQTYYLLYRNLLLKRRNLVQILQEILLPCILIVGVVVFQNLKYVTPYPPIGYDRYDSYNLLDGAYHSGGTWEPDGGIWGYTPNTTDVRDIVLATKKYFQEYDDRILAFESEADMEKAAVTGDITLGVVFSPDFPNNRTVKIRMPTRGVPMDATRFGPLSLCHSDWSSDVGEVYCETNYYLFSGFAGMQVFIQNAVASLIANETLPLPEFFMRMFPREGFISEDTPYTRVVSVVYYVIMYAPFIGVLLTNLVYEKEKKIKETMLMMGMSDAAFWFSWFIIYAIIVFVASLIVALLSKFALKAVPNADFFLVFFIFFLYGLSLVSLSFMLTPFFNKALVAGGVSTIATIVVGLVYVPIGFFTGLNDVYRWLLSFFSPIALALAMDQAIFLDIQGPGLQFSNCGISGFPPYVAMLLIDTLLYLLLAIYFDNIIPGEYGQHKPPWFCCMPSYWCKGGSGTKVTMNDVEIASFNSLQDVEPVSQDMKSTAGIRIQNLSKSFPGERGKSAIRAVKGMTLDIYEGQITCLLGHNGAGKTTLINTLTGLIQADNGQATIYGYSIRDPLQMQKIRSMMGVCPQENTLFDVLTPREHLKVYAGLKGVPRKDINAEVERVLKEVLLDESADTKSKNLSGGQKRKLCVGIALIGNPKILFLDEPSSGMDPYSRRQLWTLLKSQRQGRVMVLTTHFMDEADILADRKAVMSKGDLRCYGSSLFLKNRFGVGYHLGMVVEQSANINRITELVKNFIPSGQVSRSHGMELSYTLPLQEADRFPGLFQALEADAENRHETVAKQLGIQSYGVSMTTLEEVFLKLSEDEEGDEVIEQGDRIHLSKDAAAEADYIRPGDVEPMSFDLRHLRMQELRPGKKQIKALCKVQFYQILRNPKTYFFRLAIPLLFMVLAAILVAFVSFDYSYGGDKGPIVLDPKMYLKSSSGSHLTRLTSLLYQNNLTGSEDVKLLFDQFDRMGLTDREKVDDMSELLSVFPHSLATVATELGTNGVPKFVALYNGTAVHSVPVILNILSNAIVPLQTGGRVVADMTFVNHVFPEVLYTDSVLNSGILFILCLALALTLFPIGFMTHVVKEREEKIRTQLRVSGVKPDTYWISHFLIDAAQMTFIVIIAIIFSLIVGFSIGGLSLITGGGMFTFILFMIIFIPLQVFFSYCLSFLFQEYKTCQPFAIVFYIFIPLALMVPTVFIELLTKPEAGSDEVVDNPLAKKLHYVFSFFYPPYALFGELYYIDKIYQRAYKKEEIDKLTFSVYFDFDNSIFPTIIIAFASLVVTMFLLHVLEVISAGGNWKDVLGLSKKDDTVQPNDDIIADEDSDVMRERDKISGIFTDGNTPPQCAMAVSGLRREFHQTSCCCCCRKHTCKTAVRNLSMSVNEGEVFGLLGPNGAGKTTSMKIMTADVKATKGQVRIAGYDIRSSLNDALSEMGYCPQHDPLYESVTVCEHLEVYALIKGYHPKDVKNVAQHYMEAVNITEHANKLSQNLSGGTKRKLCFAISMLGKPKIVFLDEPSTGMDPSSKRFIWNTIITSFSDKKGAILSTHSMEEADAVCSRVGIMVAGKLMCLGTTQHLKGKYGCGYSLEVKLNPGQAYYSMDHTTGQATQLLTRLLADLDAMIRNHFPGAEVIENFGERVTYRVPNDEVTSLSSIFAALEGGKDKLFIEEYSFSQATLEQVFLEFAKMQPDDGNAEAPSSPTRHVVSQS